jgi:hypothetical protein
MERQILPAILTIAANLQQMICLLRRKIVHLRYALAKQPCKNGVVSGEGVLGQQ